MSVPSSVNIDASTNPALHATARVVRGHVRLQPLDPLGTSMPAQQLQRTRGHALPALASVGPVRNVAAAVGLPAQLASAEELS